MSINPERLRYQKNALSFWMCILAILFNILSLIFFYEDTIMVPNFLIGIDIVVNILFLMFVFLGSEKSKAYVLHWSYILAAIAVIQIVRVFVAPLYFFQRDGISQTTFILTVVFLVASGATLLTAAIMCYIKSKELQKYLRSIKERV